jgi:DNA polymerase elongation subunit (family B)
MSFVDAYYDREGDRVHVVERNNGKREFKTYPAEYVFYYDDPKGKHRSIYNQPVSRFVAKTHKAMQREKRIMSGKRLYESDINPVNRILEKYYKDADIPTLHTAFFDIEVDFHDEKGFSPTTDPFNKVTAVSLYLDWLDQLITLAIPPKGVDWEEAQEIASVYDNCFMYTDEKQLLRDFLQLIEDADIISGWNSEGYDVPYLVNRVVRVISKEETRKFCLWNKLPKKRTFERFGNENETYDLTGRIHLDYMQLYRKYTYHEMHSYSLDAIGEYELDERKVAYEGSLDQLYNTDFPTFIDYNRQDAHLIYKLDRKLKFIDLANAVAHANTVSIPKTAGAVGVTEQAIINEAHERGMVIPDRDRSEREDTQAAGAYVAYPKKGLHRDIGSVDLNSLYPSVLRALNMANETIVGQLRPIETDKLIRERMAEKIDPKTGKKKKGMSFAAAWEGLFGTLEYTAVMERRSDVEITIDWDPNGEYSSFNKDMGGSTITAKQVYELIFESGHNWALSANGTIFTYDREGIIPGLLARWYKERKELQAKLKEAVAAGDEAAIEFWDKRQLVKKINLNSLYGALLNAGCRFFDKRIGQSTTLTGRAVARHMDAHVNEFLTGEYDHTGKCIIYGDTDSAYFSAWPVVKDAVERGEQEWSTETAIALYDSIAEDVNESFPGFMRRAFHAPKEKGEIIRCGREIVGSNSLFITKKRYAIMVVDDEGKRRDVDGKPGKVKAMGLDLKRSDTPPVIQNFLKELLDMVLTNHGKDEVIEHIITFKKEFEQIPPWEKGSPKRINNLTKYTALEEDSQRRHNKPARLPGHVRAGYNYNKLRRMNGDNYTMEIQDGTKAIICKLKNNPLGITSVARPTDEHNIPQWFKDLPFDDETMELTVIDKKIENLLGVLNWGLADATDISSTFNDLFDF